MKYSTECTVCGGGTNNPNGPCVGHHSPAPAPVAVPDGFVLVPRVPTAAMVEAGAAVDDERASVWDAMLAAAPSAPATVASEHESEMRYEIELPDGTPAHLTCYGSERDMKRLRSRLEYFHNLAAELATLRAQLAERDAEIARLIDGSSVLCRALLASPASVGGMVLPEYWLVDCPDGTSVREYSAAQAMAYKSDPAFYVVPVGRVELPPELLPPPPAIASQEVGND